MMPADSAARELLDSRSPGVEPVVRERLIAEAAGNPLALVELPEALRSEQRAGGAPLATARLPLTARLERAFAVQESALPAATRSLLLVAAADDGGSLGELLEAASVLERDALTAETAASAIAARCCQ